MYDATHDSRKDTVRVKSATGAMEIKCLRCSGSGHTAVNCERDPHFESLSEHVYVKDETCPPDTYFPRTSRSGNGDIILEDEAHFTDGDRSADVMNLEELDARVQGARFEKNSTGSGRHGEEDRRRGGEHHPTQAATRDERQPQRGSVSEGVEEGAISTGEEAVKTERDAGTLQTGVYAQRRQQGLRKYPGKEADGIPRTKGNRQYGLRRGRTAVDATQEACSSSGSTSRTRSTPFHGVGSGKGCGGRAPEYLQNLVRNYLSDRRIEYPIMGWRTEMDPERETAGVAKLICYGDGTLPITKPQDTKAGRPRNEIQAMGLLMKIEKKTHELGQRKRDTPNHKRKRKRQAEAVIVEREEEILRMLHKLEWAVAEIRSPTKQTEKKQDAAPKWKRQDACGDSTGDRRSGTAHGCCSEEDLSERDQARVRKSKTGGLVMDVGGEGKEKKAEELSRSHHAILENKAVRIRRCPKKMAQLKVIHLDESVQKELTARVAEAAEYSILGVRITS
ncbi:UNVERIFIED_CONTAM: hypothetical protein PYX00_002605 [Menopon gallinae]|uniref:CCHC-type domain-containing protein n=1 Tax=Menopon gallinae TaxID=328185 RepID=A0AAW2HYL8_9NEOP